MSTGSRLVLGFLLFAAFVFEPYVLPSPGRVAVRRGAAPRLARDRGEVVEHVDGSGPVRNVEIQHRAPLRERPDGAPIRPETHAFQPIRAASMQEGEELFLGARRHRFFRSASVGSGLRGRVMIRPDRCPLKGGRGRFRDAFGTSAGAPDLGEGNIWRYEI